jgi:hypothetical protein
MSFTFSPKKSENHTLKVKLGEEYWKFDIAVMPKLDAQKQIYFAEIKIGNHTRRCCMVGTKWVII